MIYRSCFQHLAQIERKRIVTAPNVRMRLNRGERPLRLDQPVQNAVASALMRQLGTVQQYPSYPEFYQKLSRHIGVPVENIVVGAGIEEFIRTLMFMCCEPGENAAVLWPTCAMYDIYAKAFGVNLVPILTEPGIRQPVVSDKISGDLLYFGYNPRVIFLPNPGQPVETYYDLDQLSEVAGWCRARNILLVIDEAHHGFGAQSALPLIEYYSNVLVLRTFSKFYGAASIRVGYAVGQERVIKPLDAVRPSGEISGPSMAIASALLDCHDELVFSAQQTANARDALVERIKRLGLRAYGRVGFSVLIQFPSDSVALAMGERLAKRGVYVKTGFPPPVSACMLVACGGPGLMGEFYGEFERCWAEVCVG